MEVKGRGMRNMASELPDPAVVNDYYSKFWSSESWGSSEPNEDEELRARAIKRLIEEFVVSSEATARALQILDLGCGRGWLTRLLSDYGSVLGIDPVPAAIERARLLFPTLNVRLAKGSDLLSEGCAGQFDLIVSSEVIEHVIDNQKKEFVQNIYQLLKPGGFAILTTPRGELKKLWSRMGEPAQPVEDWIGETDLRRLCESVSLRVIARDRVFLPQFPFDWMSRIAASKTRFSVSPISERLRRRRAIYQVVLLRRDSDFVNAPLGQKS